MKNSLIAVAMAAAFVAANAASAAMSKADFEARKERLEADHEVAKRKCDTFAGNAKDICMAEAKGRHRVAKTELEERYKDSPKARYNVRMARAEADYDVAKEKCDDRAGAQKDACLQEAKAAYARDKADAVASRSR